MSIRDRLRQFALAMAAALPLVFAAPASANVVAEIDLSRQMMEVTVDGAWYATWPVSTARKGYRTPTGSFRPTVLKRMWYSRKYDHSPMPYSIFYSGHFAIHGTDQVRKLGRPASSGCIRLHPRNAAKLFSLVQSEGLKNMRVVVVD